MIKFSKEKVLLFQQILAQEAGGKAGIRDMNLLDSALESAFATFDGIDLYPTKEEKAAKLGYGIISNHAFLDGNKRTGMYTLISFLEVNGITFNATNDEVFKMGVAIAAGVAKYDDVLDWVKKHTCAR
ncbi:MAG: type II toxin-antitoxin system death-on-curing family toxin [Firmicutes bacterium]|nr:type II toxin-antitoxin system death-on-curing family toxin [Bacillota bacterium]